MTTMWKYPQNNHTPFMFQVKVEADLIPFQINLSPSPHSPIAGTFCQYLLNYACG